MAKWISRGSELPTIWPSMGLLAATFTSGLKPAIAAVTLSAGATVGVEQNSNPITLSERQAQDYVARGVIPRQNDTAKRLTASAGAKAGTNGPSHFQLQGTYTKVDNVNFKTLDHSEYSVGGDIGWQPSRGFDISVVASQVRSPVDLNSIGGQEIVQKTSSQAESTLRLRPLPSWQLSLKPAWYQLEVPLPGAGQFNLKESSGSIGLEYLGTGRLVPGFYATESRGTYSGIENATEYRQRGVGASLNYKVTDFSTFSLAVGRAERVTQLSTPANNSQARLLEGTQPASTGSLTYQRELSVKTSAYVRVFRNFQPYTVGVNTMVGTGVDGGIVWKPTPKLSATLDSGFVQLTVHGLEVSPTVNTREDLVRNFSASFKYLTTRRISLRTYVTRSMHNSNVRSAVFNQTIAGLELAASVN